ncbi:MAG: RNA polymerase sigma factor [Bacteroidia bacterium]
MVFTSKKTYKFQSTARHNELIEEVLMGNQKSSNELYALLMPFVKAIIYRKIFTIDKNEINILAHDIVSFIFEQLAKFTKGKNIYAWSGRITLNKIIDLHRRKKNGVSLHQFANENDEYSFAIFSTETTPESILIDGERYKRLLNILMDLPEEKRKLILDYSEGKTMQELSLQFGKNVGAITTEIHRIKKEIKPRFLKF